MVEYDLNMTSVKVKVEEEAGLVFINFSEKNNIPSLKEYLDNYLPIVADLHNIKNMRRVHEKNYKLKSNWKLYVEVDMETLHTPYIHKNSIGVQPVEQSPAKGEWIGVFSRSQETVALKPGVRNLGFPFNHGIYGDGLNGTHFSIIYPGFFIVVAQDCMWWIQKTAISHESVAINVGYCFPEETISRSDFESVSKLYFERLDQVIKEDDLITEYQQHGLHADFQGFYTIQESTVLQLDKEIIARTIGWL